METQHENFITCGIGLLSLCLLIRYCIGRRRFYRRGSCGLQQFSSYHKAVTRGFLETILLMIGNCCGWAGLVLLAIAGLTN